VLGYAGYAIVLNPWALTLIGMTLVATTSICFSQLFAHVREVYVAAPIEGRSGQSAFAISLVRVCFSVAWTGGPAAAAAVLAVLGFHGLFLSAAGLYLLFFLGVCRFVPPVAPPAPPPGNVPMSMGQALAQRDLLTCFLAFATVFAAHALNLVSLPLFFTTALGGSTRDLGIVFCIGPLTELPLMLWFGRCSTRTGRFRLIQWGMAVTVLYFAALLMASQPWHVFPVQMLNGVSFAILSNVGIMFFQDLRPGRAGLATSVFANASNGGNLVGFLLFGVGFELAGYRGLQTGCALLSLLALLLLRQVRGMAAAVD
jgi:SET family sugar efflux transporter-like MFS transporter